MEERVCVCACMCVCVCVVKPALAANKVRLFAWFAAGHTVHSGTVIFVP